MSDLVTQNLLSALGETAYTLQDNPATTRYKGELLAIGQGFRRLIHNNPLDAETLSAIKTLHVGHEDSAIALCRAFTRIVNFNFHPDWSSPAKFDKDGLHIWPEDGSEWKA